MNPVCSIKEKPLTPSYLAPFAKRRQDFLAAIGDGTAILRSAPLAVMHNDVEYNFRQDSDFST